MLILMLTIGPYLRTSGPYLEKFLQTIRGERLTLKLKTYNFGESDVKVCGYFIGSGTRRADPNEVASVQYLKARETKTQVRQTLGIFSWIQDYIAVFAAHTKSLTDLTPE